MRASFLLSQRQHIFIFIDLVHHPIGKVPCFAVQRLAAVGAQDIGAVRQGEEVPLFAVGKGNILHLLPVEHMLPDELIMRQDAGLGEAQTVQPAGIVRVGGFARFFRCGICPPHSITKPLWGKRVPISS